MIVKGDQDSIIAKEFLKNWNTKKPMLVKLLGYTECTPFHQTELDSSILARAWYGAERDTSA